MRPVVLFIHQPFDGDREDCLENGAEVRAIVEAAQRRRPGSVVAVFAGHAHPDFVREVGGVHHFEINSASYWWLENPEARGEAFPPEVHRAHPHLRSVVGWRDPLWAVVTVDLERNELRLTGRRSTWIGRSPWERVEKTAWTEAELHPWISDRRIVLPGA